jgi:hypothetical protein
MLLGIDPERINRPKKPTKNELKEGIIRPFPDAPVKIDFFEDRLYGRCTPKYVAVPYGRMFTRSEETVLANAMVDTCVSFYGERMYKETLDGFRNFIIRKCKLAGLRENHNTSDSYGTPQEQLDAINSYVEREFCGRELRETPMDRYYDAYRDVQAIHKITMMEESRKAVRMAEEEEKKRKEEYQKYKNIWY